ncbi:FAD-dependent oxidoreductase [Nocardia yamanashiensis]|uniref:FAD-dependent oxidoreductase n=1 Tax=Nocardia yamanashiensis TaxID=209247 RepID=UPI00083784D3|nr:FAD-dependent oxidoreductase [Nocardia yamanashiensis]
MNRHVVVIGGGPAGTAAAEAALRHGATVTLVDANEALGGQYNRRIPADYGVRRPLRIGHGYPAAERRARLLHEHPRCEYLARAAVFHLERHPEGGCPTVRLLIGVEGERRIHREVRGDALIIATGAYDRVCPFPGWDLPGVYTAGAAQTLVKTQRLLIGRSVLVSGTGPFLLPVAHSLAQGGARVRAVLEANPARRILRHWAARPWELRHSAGKAAELLEYASSGLRHRIPLRTSTAVVAVAGDGRVEEATVARLDEHWSPIPGSHTTVAVDAVAVSHGFTPQLELAVAAGARLTAHGFVSVDQNQRTTVDSVWAAGELTGIGGAQVAAIEGTVAGIAAAGGDPSQERGLTARHRTAGQFVARLAGAHPIGAGATGWSRPDTVICRCENTTRAELTTTWTGVAGTSYRAAKLATRAGLGPCQGRICGSAIADLRAAHWGATADATHPRAAHAETADDSAPGGRCGTAGCTPAGLAAATPAARPLAAIVRLRELAELDTQGPS